MRDLVWAHIVDYNSIKLKVFFDIYYCAIEISQDLTLLYPKIITKIITSCIYIKNAIAWLLQ